MHIETLDEQRLRCLTHILELPEIRPFYLAGGTALSLQLGLRVSVDFDFMTERRFNSGAVLDAVKKQFTNTRVLHLDPDTCDLLVDGIQISFMYYPYPLITEPVRGNDCLNKLQMAGINDISAMKLSAIGGRGSRKDFYDLYQIYQCCSGFNGEKLLKNAVNKFGTDTDLTYMLMGLNYFDDAESEVLPKQFIQTDWNEIKRFFTEEQKHLFMLYESRFKNGKQ